MVKEKKSARILFMKKKNKKKNTKTNKYAMRTFLNLSQSARDRVQRDIGSFDLRGYRFECLIHYVGVVAKSNSTHRYDVPRCKHVYALPTWGRVC